MSTAKARLLSRYAVSLVLVFFASYVQTACATTIEIKNPSALTRASETIAIPVTTLRAEIGNQPLEQLLVKDESNRYQLTQFIDNDLDGKLDELLFQVSLKAYEVRRFTLEFRLDSEEKKPRSDAVAISRFVPERFDDYAWENNRVAFRAFGPKLQKMAESGIDGGSISSGIDVWLKRVSYPILDSWYQRNLTTPGYYHTDHGEGYDPYHVGKSRGLGGTGLWQNGKFSTSRNFTDWKVIANGPIRSTFELYYAPWSAYGIRETKRISLDLHSHFSTIKVSWTAAAVPESQYAVGLALHKAEGRTAMNTRAGWARYWEPMDDSWLGTGLIFNPQDVTDMFKREARMEDDNHIVVLIRPSATFSYSVGFAWLKSPYIDSAEGWDSIVAAEVNKRVAPLVFSFK